MLTAIIYNKTIQAKTFTQLKRLASREANKKYRPYDEFYLISAPGIQPLLFTRRNKKFSNNTIIKGVWS